ncbi:MAG: Sjogren's syndrome/scleroderma autoantigen 1 family protein [Candidatus Odinarchaeota archaeon]
MADLLRSGNTMLNTACPVCNNPIFRNRDGDTFCPTCNRTIKIVKDNAYTNKSTKSREFYHKEQEDSSYKRKIELLKTLEEVLFEKIEAITNKLRNETNLQDIEIYTKILINCFEILTKTPFNREK